MNNLATNELRQIIPMKEREILVCGKCGSPLIKFIQLDLYRCSECQKIHLPYIVNAIDIEGHIRNCETFETAMPASNWATDEKAEYKIFELQQNLKEERMKQDGRLE